MCFRTILILLIKHANLFSINNNNNNNNKIKLLTNRLGPFGHFLNITCAHRVSCYLCYLCRDLARSSDLSTALRSDHWYSKNAPSPSNIKWENLSKIGAIWWFRVILINLILIILMIFFTTPSILIEKLTPWSDLLKKSTFEVSFLTFCFIC